MFASRSGQSVIEVLVASAIAVVLITGAIVIIAPTLQGSRASTTRSISVGRAMELIENVRTWSESDWSRILALSTSTSSLYYLSTSTSPFTVQSGTESLQLSTTSYTRYFFLGDVYRDTSGAVVASGGTYDASTKKITVVYSLHNNATTSMVTYVTRYASRVIYQTDWSGGGNVEGPATSTANTFATSSNVNVVTSTGSMYINL